MKSNNSHKPFPKTLSLKQMIGPSFIILALGLGSGEVILWPYLTANYGLGIAWGALLGISFQFFINMEIERYALVRGESVFVGLKELFKWAPYWFIVSTFIGFGLPGIVAASAQLFAAAIGMESFKWIAVVFLIVIGLILSSGKTVYGIMELITRSVIIIGVPIIFILTLFVVTTADWVKLFQGFIGQGDGYRLLPQGIDLAVFLAAFAYAGAGGNLNLTQSIYIKEKGYGMGKYAQKVTGLFRQNDKQMFVKLTGEQAGVDSNSVQTYIAWWRKVNLEHGLVFWLVGLFTMSLLMLLSYATAYGQAGNASGINFVINQADMLGQALWPGAGVLFLALAAIMLFQTQLGVMDSTSRIMAENTALIKLKDKISGRINLSKIYYIYIWAQIAFGIFLFLFNITEPKLLIVLGAVINAVAMFIHIGLVNWMNYKVLPKPYQAKLWRKIVMLSIFMFFAYFSYITLADKLG